MLRRIIRPNHSKSTFFALHVTPSPVLSNMPVSSPASQGCARDRTLPASSKPTTASSTRRWGVMYWSKIENFIQKPGAYIGSAVMCSFRYASLHARGALTKIPYVMFDREEPESEIDMLRCYVFAYRLLFVTHCPKLEWALRPSSRCSGTAFTLNRVSYKTVSKNWINLSWRLRT